MKYLSLFKVWVAILAIVAGLFILSTEGQAAMSVLRFYSYTSYDTCVATSGGGINGTMLLEDGKISTYVNSGVIGFTSDGKMYYTAKGTQLLEHDQISAGEVPIKNREITRNCEGTYTITGRKIEAELTCSGVLYNGLKFITTDVRVNGYIGMRKKMITGSNIQGNIQHTTFYNSNDNPVGTMDQMCVGSINLIETTLIYRL